MVSIWATSDLDLGYLSEAETIRWPDDVNPFEIAYQTAMQSSHDTVSVPPMLQHALSRVQGATRHLFRNHGRLHWFLREDAVMRRLIGGGPAQVPTSSWLHMPDTIAQIHDTSERYQEYLEHLFPD